jgi:hypothetical protein
VGCWGARGDRKTSSALDGLMILADRHRAAGFPLPYRVMAVTGSHVEHQLKLCRTLVAPHWSGAWRLSNDDHDAMLVIDGVPLLALDLSGVADNNAYDKLRMEAHALWADEAAPAATEGATGVDDTAWTMGITSLRLPTVRNVAVLTSNYPDDDYWAWVRFEAKPAPSTVSVRIPPGESASEADRAQ